MAWLYQDPQSRNYKVCFRHNGRSYKKSLRTRETSVAEGILGGVKRTLMRLEQNLLTLPPDADILTYVLSDGRQAEKPLPDIKVVTLQDVIDRYTAACSVGAMEQNSLDTVKMHLRHITKTLGKGFVMSMLKLTDLQRHVERRSKQRGIHKRPLSPATVRKEIASLRAAWNWAAQSEMVTGPFPNRGLKYPKSSEKPPFQTWDEIDRQIVAGVTPAQEKDLWDCLYLIPSQIEELLAFVKTNANHPFLYPMFTFAAHTGARRSEMMRALRNDVDFAGRTVLIREKKRNRGQSTIRRVPLSPLLAQVLQDWLAIHPGGQNLFGHPLEVIRSRKKRTEFTPLTRNEAHDHFHRTLNESKWQVLRGWHTLRHSFASNCAAAGVDQRFINSWMGHLTESMVRRYQHLRPDKQQEALQLVFAR